ncbi:MAG TPA: hypothetical protein VFP23_04880 [Solirubrobacterales bacterium]|nr:hypothetical protein [Solirubrobacterales bacterium]
MNEGARFPRIAAKAGHYESFYLKACRPGGGQGVWIRHTVHKRPGAEPNGSIWFVLFDREAERPRATKVTVPAGELSAPAGSWIKVSSAEIGPGFARASGAPYVPIADIKRTGTGEERVGDGKGTVSWDLTFSGDARSCKYLPADWLYEAPVPRTKFVAPYPNACFDGRLEIDGETIELGGWPGMIGHNWGSEHAERWVWLEGTGFEGSPDTYFDAGAARVRLGRWTTPWIPSGMLVLDGEAHRLGGIGKVRAASIEETPTECSFVLPGKDIVVRGRVSAPKKDFVGWIYADPKGPEHNTVNCSVADLELTIERPALPSRRLTLSAGAAYEFGMRETDHGIPIQPFPDG